MTGNPTYGTHANWKLHQTKNWKDLIACFQVGAKYPQFAHQVLEAVSDGLNERKLIEDAGYQKSVELLVEMAIGAQRKDFIGHMREMGIGLSDNPRPQELIAKVADAIEEASWAGGHARQGVQWHALVRVPRAPGRADALPRTLPQTIQGTGGASAQGASRHQRRGCIRPLRAMGQGVRL